MSIRSTILNASRPRLTPRGQPNTRRFLLTLAIETSCDDTSVAVLEKRSSSDGQTSAVLHFHKKITSNNTAYHGVHPLASLYSHQENLAGLVDEAILHLPPKDTSQASRGSNDVLSKKLPDFISVTRGPGMRSNLFTGIDTAKGLAAAWQVDLVGVNHMQAHALTPRLVTALEKHQLDDASGEGLPKEPIPTSIAIEPAFPFLSLLASGGHTLLIRSASLTEHTVLASTNDIAVGECLDKVARAILPVELLQAARSTMYGALLERFAFSNSEPEIEAHGHKDLAEGHRLEDNTAREYCRLYATRYSYVVPKNHEEALKHNITKWGWGFNRPLHKAGGGLKNRSLEMSFSGLMTAVERVARYQMDPTTGKLTKIERPAGSLTNEERKDMAREAMRAAFEHVASRVVLGLQEPWTENPGLSSSPVSTVVMSGGVASNSYLRYILASTLVAHGHANVRLVFPPPSLCTDNAAMIAWTGLEMYQAGYKDPRSIRGIRKWPLDQLLSPPTED